jgi:hypothetical protein
MGKEIMSECKCEFKLLRGGLPYRMMNGFVLCIVSDGVSL